MEKLINPDKVEYKVSAKVENCKIWFRVVFEIEVDGEKSCLTCINEGLGVLDIGDNFKSDEAWHGRLLSDIEKQGILLLVRANHGEILETQREFYRKMILAVSSDLEISGVL